MRNAPTLQTSRHRELDSESDGFLPLPRCWILLHFPGSWICPGCSGLTEAHSTGCTTPTSFWELSFGAWMLQRTEWVSGERHLPLPRKDTATPFLFSPGIQTGIWTRPKRRTDLVPAWFSQNESILLKFQNQFSFQAKRMQNWLERENRVYRKRTLCCRTPREPSVSR